MEQASKTRKKETLEATIIRANGRRINLGLISYYHESHPIKTWIVNKLIFIKRKIKGV